MHHCPESFGAAIDAYRGRSGRHRRFCARAVVILIASFAFVCGAAAQNVMVPAAGPDPMDASAAPMSQYGNVSFFSQDLGTVLRLRYNTESYGQDRQGNFDIGSMQVVTFEDAAAFLDGQVTMNDVNGVGFNIGIGYRMVGFPPYAMDTGRVEGISLWVDGTHTDAGNFFPQVGISLESLGELWDFRANGYVPVGKQDQIGEFEPTGETGFFGNSLSQLTQAVVDSSFTVGEVEVARRLGVERDAWAFAGPYFLTNDDEDSAGGRVGVRGYAYPDLLVQMAVSHDEIFHTNATFAVQWFVGRTRTNYEPACDVRDRLREPVMRNDYVALGKGTQAGGIALTNPDGSALRIVHVDSNAPAGGDGTFENPYNEINQANGAGSLAGDIVFAHSESVFDTSIILKDNQRFLGEGDNVTFTVNTLQEGSVTIPESSPGARALARPMIVAALGDAVTLADNNEVANFDIDGQNVTARAIAALAGGAGNPILHDLAISNTTGDGIAFTPKTIVNPNNAAQMAVRGNVTITDVTFDTIGGDDIDINSFTATDVTDPNVTLQETIAITDVSSLNGNGAGLRLQNTHSAGTATLTNYTNGNATAGSGGGLVGQGVLRFNDIAGDITVNNADIKNNTGFAFDFLNVATTTAVTLGTNSSYDGGAGAAGGLRADNFDGTLTASNTTFTGGTLSGASLLNDSDGTFNFQSTVTFASITGTAFEINGDTAGGGTDLFGGSVTVAGTITNDTNRSVTVENVTTGADISFNGNITDTGTGLFVNSNSGGQVTFAGDLAMTIDTAGATAVAVTNNTGASVDFAGDMTIVSTSTANGFVATGGGTLSAPSTTNSVSTATGQPVQITGMTIAAAGVHFADVNRTAAAGTNAIQLENNTGGPITIGNTTDSAGDAGTIVGGTVDAIRIVDSANVSVNGIRVNNTAAVSGVFVQKSNAAAMITNLSDLELNGGDIGVETIGGGTGAVTMTINDTAINSPTSRGLLFDNLDVGTVNVNAVTIDGNNANAAAQGVLINDSNASFTFDAATSIREFSSTDFEVAGGAGTVSFAGDIINSTTVNPGDTTGRSVHIHNVTGGTTTFTAASSINDDNQGMLVTANTGGTHTFLGNNDFNTGANDAVTVTNNTGATVSLSDLAITTTSGKGFTATGGGTVTVLGTTNTIATTTGVGLDIEDMTIGAADVAFQSVTVNGAVNGVVLRNLTGAGGVAIGNAAGAQNSGGTLTTTADAIVLENTADVDLRHMQIVSAGGQGVNIDQTAAATTTMDVTIQDLNLDASTGTGISVLGANNAQIFNLRLTDSDLEENVDMSITGSGAFNMLVANNDINTAGTDIAFALSFSGSAANGDLTFNGANNFVATNASALSITTAGATFKTIDLLVEDSVFSNSSADPGVEFLSAGNTLMNATIRSNVFDNAGAGTDFAIDANGAQARIRMNLGGDVAADFNTAAGSGDYQVTVAGGATFDVFDRDDTFNDLRNNGDVVPNPNAGAFNNTAVAPPLPVVP